MHAIPPVETTESSQSHCAALAGVHRKQVLHTMVSVREAKAYMYRTNRLVRIPVACLRNCGQRVFSSPKHWRKNFEWCNDRR
jgi:hypothetical protein